MNLTNLPLDVLGHIFVFLNIGNEKKVVYRDSENVDGSTSKITLKVSYIPSKLCLINKKWFAAFLNSKCKVCDTGKYDFIKFKCINCYHVLNGNKRRKLLKN